MTDYRSGPEKYLRDVIDNRVEEIIWELVDTSIIRHQDRLLKEYPELAKEVESVAWKVITEPPTEWILYADRLLYKTLEELSNSHRELVERLKILIIYVEYAPDEVNGARVDRILPQLDRNLYQALSTVIDNMVLKELESSIGFLNYVLNEDSERYLDFGRWEILAIILTFTAFFLKGRFSSASTRRSEFNTG